MQRTEAGANSEAIPSVRINGVWQTIRGFIFWSHERGTIQYDIMVTLILLFVFLTPLWVNFKDKPVEHNPHQTGVTVVPDAAGGLVYEIEAAAISTKADASLQDQLLAIIEPISGEVSISKVEKEYDKSGHVSSYRVWVER